MHLVGGTQIPLAVAMAVVLGTMVSGRANFVLLTPCTPEPLSPRLSEWHTRRRLSNV